VKRTLFFLLVLASFCWGEIKGTLVNGTTGKPLPASTVTLVETGAGGMREGLQARTDALGRFSLNASPKPPFLLSTIFEGVTYNHLIENVPATGEVGLEVYTATARQGAIKLSKHMILLTPSAGQMAVNEVMLYDNPGNTTWTGAASGTLSFSLPDAAQGKVTVHATAPGGMDLEQRAEAISDPGVYRVKFPIKPGQTRFDVSYSVPFEEGSTYSGRIVTKDENTYLIVPAGMTLEGDHLTDLGIEQRTSTHIYGLTAATYGVKLAAATAGSESQQADGNAPPIEEIPPRVSSRAALILAAASAVLALGFVILYRMPLPSTSPKETHERGRR
jgi:hypothetical protein